MPKPPNNAFGRKNNFEQEVSRGLLLADRMAQAAAEGKLDEFLKKEMPDNEYARNLAGMMMGMTGVGAGVKSASDAKTGQQHQPDKEPSTEVPEDVKQAIMEGDLQSLKTLLRREHQKRNPGASAGSQEEAVPSPPAPHAPSPQEPAINKDIIDALVNTATENNVSLDWIILRAIKVYVQEYLKTGKL